MITKNQFFKNNNDIFNYFNCYNIINSLFKT